MLEWHARVVLGPDRDAWYDGRFMEEWADPSALGALPGAFARFDAADLRRALHATVRLYLRLANAVAAALGYVFPSPGEARFIAWLQAQLDQV